jgi:hypothetical protein
LYVEELFLAFPTADAAAVKLTVAIYVTSWRSDTHSVSKQFNIHRLTVCVHFELPTALTR